MTLSIVLYTQCGFHINHFRILLLTHYFIFLSFCCVFIFKWYPFGNPIFSVDQSEWICMKLYFGKKNSSSPLHHPTFLFQVLNVNCDTTYCYIWGSYDLFTHYFFALFVLFLWTTFSVMIFIIIDSICKCFNYVDSFLEWFWLGSLMYHKSFCF